MIYIALKWNYDLGVHWSLIKSKMQSYVEVGNGSPFCSQGKQALFWLTIKLSFNAWCYLSSL